MLCKYNDNITIEYIMPRQYGQADVKLEEKSLYRANKYTYHLI